MNEEFEKQKGRTYLKSSLHLRVTEGKQGDYARSVLVGLQFGILHLPLNFIAYVARPLIEDIATVLFQSGRNFIALLVSAGTGLQMGFDGSLDAVDEPINVLEINDAG